MFIESKYILDYNRKVLTPFGYQRIEQVHKTAPLPALKIIHQHEVNGKTVSGEIEVAKFHTFIVQQQEISACDLAVGDFLETPDGLSEIIDIQDIGNVELYDITLDQSEFDNYWYYSNNVLSHNSGKSITVACYLTWLFNFHRDMNIGIVANRSKQATEFLSNVKDIFSRLPIWLQQGISVWNVTGIANELGMRVLTDVPSQDSFRGFTMNCIVIDECVHGREVITVRDKRTGEISTMPIEEFYEKI